MSVSRNNGNFNLFGLNVNLPTRTIKQVKDTATKHLGELVSPIFDYLEDNQKVFTGELTDELNKYNAQMYRYGQVMRKGTQKSGFSIDA